jgi:hypothetical protein
MLFATTSNGVYRCDIGKREARRILGNRHTPGFLKPEARGFFGIVRHAPTGHVLVASRERALLRFGKLAADVGLHLIDPNTFRATLLTKVKDIHDIHQIAWHDGRAFLTDTGKNRIVIYDPEDGKRMIANVGAVRDDVNHINAILVHEGHLYVGLNNRGVAPAALLRLPLSKLYKIVADNRQADLLQAAERIEFASLRHTHDLEPDASGKLYACVSYNGSVFDTASQQTILKVGDWTRGLAFAADKLWVGTSELAGRKDRHSEKLDGAISLYSLPDLKLTDRLVLRGAGQVNDLLWLEDKGSGREQTP